MLWMVTNASLPSIPEKVVYATQTDVAPTIADIINLNPHSKWQGISLLRQNKVKSCHQVNDLESVRALMYMTPQGFYKYMVGDSIPSQVYELFSDINETKNVYNTIPSELLQTLKAEYQICFS